jgi:hypothetical protein
MCYLKYLAMARDYFERFPKDRYRRGAAQARGKKNPPGVTGGLC